METDLLETLLWKWKKVDPAVYTKLYGERSELRILRVKLCAALSKVSVTSDISALIHKAHINLPTLYIAYRRVLDLDAKKPCNFPELISRVRLVSPQRSVNIFQSFAATKPIPVSNL